MSTSPVTITAEAVAEAARAAKDAQATLEAAILSYRATGASLRAVAEAAGLSAPGVLGVLRRHDTH
jgi:hypothetical protein